MKTRSLMIIAVMIFVSGSMFAQGNPNQKNRGADRPFMNIPDLTEDQKEQITEIRTDHMKEVLPLRNELNEKEARLQTISTGENVDQNKINTTIDEIGKIKIDLAKKRAAFKQDIRKILTEDQRVFFDMHSGNKHNKQKMKHHPQNRQMQK